MNRKRLPNKREGIRFVIGDFHVSTGEYDDGSLGEIFVEHKREGSFAKDILNAFAMGVSLGLQHGVTLDDFQHTFRHFNMDPDLIRELFHELELHYGGSTHASQGAQVGPKMDSL